MKLPIPILFGVSCPRPRHQSALSRHWTATIVLLVSVLSLASPLNLLAQERATSSSSQNNLVKFQVGFPRNLPVGVAQEWLKTLSEAGADGVRLVLDPDFELRIAGEKFKSKLTITVNAKVTPKQELVVEGKSFSRSDLEGLRAWIKKLKGITSLDPAEKKGAFGLTAAELVGVYEVLGKQYPESTRGQSVTEVVRVIRRQLGVKIGADDEALAAIRDAEKGDSLMRVPEELQGLSCGTVLAAVIRPLGLVLVVNEGGKQFVIVGSRKAQEHWPVGWPPQKRPSQIAPVLFKQTEVEIDGFTLDKVLQAIEAKTGIPFVFDQNSMARNGTELQKVEVRIGHTKTYYDKLIRRCLNEAKPRLKSELRTDESGQPFLWISH